MDNLINYKAQLMSELNVQYKNLIQFLAQLPIGQKFKDFGFQNLDQGVMWIQKGIEIIQSDNTKESVVQEENKPETVVEDVPIVPKTTPFVDNKTIY